jgi:predicted aspartyl protease
MRGVLLAALLFLYVAPAWPQEACQLKRLAVIPFETDDTAHIFVPAIMMGRKTRLMLDTGGWWSLIHEDLASSLNLKERRSFDVWVVDGSGAKLDKYVTVPELQLGKVIIGKPVDFVISKSSGARLSEEFGGTLGLNFFTRMDLEIDNAGKTISLFSQDHCKGAGVHWADEAVTLKFRRKEGDPIAMPIVAADLEGETVRALFDTGSTVTYLDLAHAKRRFGIGPGSPGVEQSGSAHLPSGKKIPLYRYTFKSLTMSGIRFESVPVYLGEFDDTDLILGMNELKKLHLYFAFKDQMIHITAADAGK